MAGYLFALLLIMVISTSYGTVARAASSPAASTASKPSLSSPTLCNTCWHPALKTSWQWQLSGTVDQSYNVVMYDIDMFDNSASVVKSLHKAGRIVICYIDAGTWENWRPDAGQFPNSVKGKPVSGWLGERWL
ncbi:MAG: endo alpha-1,4 polygalactosaminidase, partial [Chloroflexi bacterium]